MTNPVASAIYDALRAAGMPRNGCFGPLSSAERESNFDPRAVGDHGQAHGLWQHHGDRVAAIRHGCGVDMRTASTQQQVKGLLWELNNREQASLAAMERAQSPGQAGADFCRLFERPANLHTEMQARAAIAEKWANVFTH